MRISDEEKIRVEIKEGEVIDTIVSHELRVIQKHDGPKFAVDAVLLAEFARVGSGDTLVDLGTGTGVVPLIIAHRKRPKGIIGIEIQPQMADMARRSAQLNDLQDVMTIITADVRDIRDILPAGRFDVVTCNPPHKQVVSGRLSANYAVAVSRHEIEGELRDFTSAAGYLLKNRGKAFFLHRPERLPELLALFNEFRIEPKRLLFVHPKRDRKAEFLLVEGVKSGGKGVTVLPPLFLDDRIG